MENKKPAQSKEIDSLSLIFDDFHNNSSKIGFRISSFSPP